MVCERAWQKEQEEKEEEEDEEDKEKEEEKEIKEDDNLRWAEEEGVEAVVMEEKVGRLWLERSEENKYMWKEADDGNPRNVSHLLYNTSSRKQMV